MEAPKPRPLTCAEGHDQAAILESTRNDLDGKVRQLTHYRVESLPWIVVTEKEEKLESQAEHERCSIRNTVHADELMETESKRGFCQGLRSEPLIGILRRTLGSPAPGSLQRLRSP